MKTTSDARLSTFHPRVFALIAILCIAPTETLAATFEVVDEELYDQPIKTQVVQHVVAIGPTTEAEIRSELRTRYGATVSRGGFRHHSKPTNIYLYIYGSREQAMAGQGLWIGMLSMDPSSEGRPRLTINEARLAALERPAEKRHGLSEEVRKNAFRERAAADRRATDEAMRRIPDSQIQKQLALENQLRERYAAQVRGKYKLSQDQFDAIAQEGLEKGWPYR